MASVKDMTPHGLDLGTARHISEDDYQKLVRQGCQPEVGDVLIAKDGNSCLDTVCEVRKKEKVVLLSSVAILRPNPGKVTTSFLRLFLDADTTRRYLKGGFITGAAIPRVILKDFERARISLPPLPIQRKIAAILSAYDDLIENNERRIKILEEMAQNLYREWFVNFRFPGHEKVRMVDSPLGEIPEGWEPCALGDLCAEVRRSVTPTEMDDDTPYVGLEHIPRRSITLTQWGGLAGVQSTKLIFNKGEILFGKIRPYFHKVVVAPVSGVCSTDAIVIVPKRPEFHAPVLCCVSSVDFVNHATQTSQGTKMPRANWKVLLNYPLPLPPEPLLTAFGSFVNDIVSKLRVMVAQNRALRQSRDLLLPKLISGELDVSELDIEVPEEAA